MSNRASVEARPHRYAVIMAGGSGTRLWPVSRRSRPKQFQPLIGAQSLLQMMYGMLSAMFDADRIFVQTPLEYCDLVKEQIPDIADAQMIVEPESRDTAPAFAYAAALLASRDPDATLAILYADNFVDPASASRFFEALSTGFAATDLYPSHLVILGVRPDFPHTGLGYIELGEPAPAPGRPGGVFATKGFIEKPDLQRAKAFGASGSFLWNTGYKIVKAGALLAMLSRSHPAYREGMARLVAGLAAGDREAAAAAFVELPRQSFEYLVAERATDMLTVAADIQWSDVGDWEIIHRYLSAPGDDGVHASGQAYQHDCENTLLISRSRQVVAIGVHDLVVIETKDAVLVMSKDRSQDMKAVLKEVFKISPDLV